MISVFSIARQAASSAAATTKSVSVRPWISAARFRRVRTAFGRRASRRAVVEVSDFMAFSLYGIMPYALSWAELLLGGFFLINIRPAVWKDNFVPSRLIEHHKTIQFFEPVVHVGCQLFRVVFLAFWVRVAILAFLGHRQHDLLFCRDIQG